MITQAARSTYRSIKLSVQRDGTLSIAIAIAIIIVGRNLLFTKTSGQAAKHIDDTDDTADTERSYLSEGDRSLGYRSRSSLDDRSLGLWYDSPIINNRPCIVVLLMFYCGNSLSNNPRLRLFAKAKMLHVWRDYNVQEGLFCSFVTWTFTVSVCHTRFCLSRIHRG